LCITVSHLIVLCVLLINCSIRVSKNHKGPCSYDVYSTNSFPQVHAVIGVLTDDTDPMVSVMKLEKAPQETYADIGGLDSQIQEIKVRDNGWVGLIRLLCIVCLL